MIVMQFVPFLIYMQRSSLRCQWWSTSKWCGSTWSIKVQSYLVVKWSWVSFIWNWSNKFHSMTRKHSYCLNLYISILCWYRLQSCHGSTHEISCWIRDESRERLFNKVLQIIDLGQRCNRKRSCTFGNDDNGLHKKWRNV